MLKINANVVYFSNVDLLLDYRIKEIKGEEFKRSMLTREKMKELLHADVAIFKGKDRKMVIIKSRY